MQFFRTLTEAHLTTPTVLTIGTFDGLHLGHQSLLTQLRASAHRQQAQTAVLAFHPRPRAIFAPEKFSHDYLTTPTERIAMFAQQNVDVLLMLPFSFELAATSASDFMGQLKHHLNMVELWAGHDFALGKGRSGTIPRLRQLGETLGYTVHEFDAWLMDGEPVSSTRIRHLISLGQVEQAAALLGRRPSVTGVVGAGDKRGRTIGFPTANLQTPSEQLLPAHGVYATMMIRHRNQQAYPSVTNVGMRPSFEGQQRTVEAYIFDFDEDIYDETFTLEFVAHLRPEQKFDHLDGLIQQIKQDAIQARHLLNSL